MTNRLVSEGYWVRGVDLEAHDHLTLKAHDFVQADLRDPVVMNDVLDAPFDEVYQFAADMGGAGYIFTGLQDVEIVQNSALINLNLIAAARRRSISNIFFASSACVYPQENQADPNNPICTEASAYPANPDSEYGWEKLFAERLYLSCNRQDGMNCRIARYHNIFGPCGTWKGGREKVPAAICRKVAEARPGDAIEIWGDGMQSRSFLHIDDCIEATRRLMQSDCPEPVNIGSEEMITINDLARMVIDISGKALTITNVPGPVGVRGRTSDNRLLHHHLGWSPVSRLRDGMEATYHWVASQADCVAAPV